MQEVKVRNCQKNIKILGNIRKSRKIELKEQYEKQETQRTMNFKRIVGMLMDFSMIEMLGN